MRVNVLGPVELLFRGVPVHLAPKERALLTLLALSPGAVVPCVRLASALWADSPPASSRAKLQGYVCVIRRAIGQRDAATGPLRTVAGDYQLQAGADAVDQLEFQALIGRARRLRADSQLPAASETFAEALEIWRGPACATVDSAIIRGAAESLEHKRMLAVDDKAAIDLDLGRYETVVEQLSVQVAAAPLRERTRALLMLGLYRRGCRADAMALYRSGRQQFAGELGLEPGPELVCLHQALLAGNERLLNAPVGEIVRAAAYPSR
jgi:DNA-binding SARP family transcriptional activator